MSELYNTWKGKGKKVSKPSSPMIGAIYQGVDKFFGKRVVGVLVEMFDQNDETILKTKEDKLISVDLNSLKLVA